MKIELSGHYSYGRLLRTSVPSVLMMLVSSVYSIVDGLFVSNFAGTTAFAALNMIWPALMMAGSIGLMFGTGGSALVAMVMGQGDSERANRIFSMLIRSLIVIGVILSALLFVFLRPISILLGAEGEMIGQCLVYGRIILLTMPLYMAELAFNSLFMTAERPQLGTWVTIASGVLNIALDALFIIVFDMGLTGAAIGTAIAFGSAGLFPLIYFSSKRWNTTSLKFVKSGTEWRNILQACSNGLSEYVGNISYNIVIMCYNLQLMKLLGEDGVAVFGILWYIGFIFASVFFGYNMAVSPIVSYNYGAGNTGELHSLLKKSIVILLVAGTVQTLASELSSGFMSGIFVGYDPELKALTAHAIRLYMLSFMICGLNLFVSAWFTALNNGIVSAIAAFGRTMVFELGSVFVLPLILGLDGIWLAVDMADLMALAMSAFLLLKFRKRYQY